METLVTVKDVMERYKCSAPTARKYIRQCEPHLEKPLATYGWAFRDWELSRIVSPKGDKYKPQWGHSLAVQRVPRCRT